MLKRVRVCCAILVSVLLLSVTGCDSRYFPAMIIAIRNVDDRLEFALCEEAELFRIAISYRTQWTKWEELIVLEGQASYEAMPIYRMGDEIPGMKITKASPDYTIKAYGEYYVSTRGSNGATGVSFDSLDFVKLKAQLGERWIYTDHTSSEKPCDFKNRVPYE